MQIPLYHLHFHKTPKLSSVVNLCSPWQQWDSGQEKKIVFLQIQNTQSEVGQLEQTVISFIFGLLLGKKRDFLCLLLSCLQLNNHLYFGGVNPDFPQLYTSCHPNALKFQYAFPKNGAICIIKLSLAIKFRKCNTDRIDLGN